MAQNLIPDSSFNLNKNKSFNPYWSGEVSGTWPFLSTQWSKDTLGGTSWVIDKVQRSDSAHSDFAFWNPLHGAMGGRNSSSVLSCQLNQPLLKDSVYEIKLWVLPPECIGIYSIQVYFSEQKFTRYNQLQKAERTELFLPDSSMIINNIVTARRKKKNEYGTFGSKWMLSFENKWLCVSGTYKAKGGESFFYIGNINPFAYVAYSSRIRKQQLVPCKNNDPNLSPGGSREFFIDDVSVRKK